MNPEAGSASSGHWPGPVWSSERHVTLVQCRKEPRKQRVSGRPLLLYTRPGLSKTMGRRQQEAGLGGQTHMSQTYVTFGISDFSEVFLPPPPLWPKVTLFSHL